MQSGAWRLSLMTKLKFIHVVTHICVCSLLLLTGKFSVWIYQFGCPLFKQHPHPCPAPHKCSLRRRCVPLQAHVHAVGPLHLSVLSLPLICSLIPEAPESYQDPGHQVDLKGWGRVVFWDSRTLEKEARPPELVVVGEYEGFSPRCLWPWAPDFL